MNPNEETLLQKTNRFTLIASFVCRLRRRRYVHKCKDLTRDDTVQCRALNPISSLKQLVTGYVDIIIFPKNKQ